MSSPSDEDDRQWLIILGIVFVWFGGIAWAWHWVVAELISYRVLVTGPNVVVHLPGTGDAGLDQLRILLVIAALLLLAALLYTRTQRRNAERQTNPRSTER